MEDENGFSHFQSLYQELAPLVLFNCTGGLCAECRNEKWKLGRWNVGIFPVKDDFSSGVTSGGRSGGETGEEKKKKNIRTKETRSR